MLFYYFHIRSEGSLIEDEEGLDLSDLDRAKAEALESARDIIADRALSGEPASLNDVFEITGESGEILLTIPFKEAVPRN